MCERVYQYVVAVAVDPITLLTVILTALAAILAALGIMIGAVAIFGYYGLKDSVKEMATKIVNEAMERKLKEYPPSADIVALVARLEKDARFVDEMRNKVVTSPDPKSVAITSKPDVQGKLPETPLESMDQQATPIEKYPGEEDGDASNDGKSS